MIKNFVICGLLSVLFYGISSYEIIFGESNNTKYQFLNKFVYFKFKYIILKEK